MVEEKSVAVEDLINQKQRRLSGIQREMAVILAICFHTQASICAEQVGDSQHIMGCLQQGQIVIFRLLNEQYNRQGLMIPPGRTAQGGALRKLVAERQPRRQAGLRLGGEIITAQAGSGSEARQ